MEKNERVDQEQVYDLITGEDLSWQNIIYDLIKTEQLDPWDIDLIVLSERYLEKIRKLEEESFFISSKVLLACSLLLRFKSEKLANNYIQELNEKLFKGKEVQKTLDIDQYVVDENELPMLVPRSPMARNKKVTLDDLMGALNKAMHTEHRRIKRKVKGHQAQQIAKMVLPRNQFIPLKVRIKKIFSLIENNLNMKKEKHLEFSALAKEKDERLASFLPILHLSNEQKIFLHQPVHFEEIYITKDIHPDDLKLIKEDLSLVEENTS